MRILVALLLLAAPVAALAQRPFPPPPGPAQSFEAYREALSVATLPAGVGGGTVIGWSLHYRGAMPHAAFVVALRPDGRVVRWRFIGGRDSPAAAEADALEACRRGDLPSAPPGSTCRVIAKDLDIAGRGPVIAPQEERIGPFRASPFHWRFKPEAAAGVVVWGHGYGGSASDGRDSPAPGFLSALNDAGWDVMRYDRSPVEDSVAFSVSRMVRGLPLLRAAGYRRVALAGQSRGAWQSLLAAAALPEAVDAVIAVAPAAHGTGAGLGAGVEDFRRALAGLPTARPRLGVVLFEDDPFDPDRDARSALVAEAARARTAPTLLLRPVAGIRGHNGMADVRFTHLYAGCLVALLQAPEAAAPRGVREAACGGG